MELFLGVIAIVVLLIFVGKITGDPSPKELSDEQIMGRMELANKWIARFNALAKPNDGLKRQHEEKQRHIMELMLELNNRHGDKQKESLAPRHATDLRADTARRSRRASQEAGDSGISGRQGRTTGQDSGSPAMTG